MSDTEILNICFFFLYEAFFFFFGTIILICVSGEE